MYAIEPPFYKCNIESKPRYGHSLISWAMDQHVSNRVTFQNIERTAKAHFGLSIRYTKVREFKSIFVNYYTNTYRGILNNLVKGPIIHADETTDKSPKGTWVRMGSDEHGGRVLFLQVRKGSEFPA